MYKKIKDSYLKYFVIGSFLLLLFIAYKVFLQNNRTPKTEMDCLTLGSNERSELCLKMLKEKSYKDFPLGLLNVSNIKSENIGYCIQISGTIKNNYSKPAFAMGLKADFSREKGSESFHYEVFSPFQVETEQIQPGSSKTFSKCMNNQTFNALKGISQWHFGVIPFSAKIFE